LPERAEITCAHTLAFFGILAKELEGSHSDFIAARHAATVNTDPVGGTVLRKPSNRTEQIVPVFVVL
jgi:hypothetical protein